MAADGYSWFQISGPLETWAPAGRSGAKSGSPGARGRRRSSDRGPPEHDDRRGRTGQAHLRRRWSGLDRSVPGRRCRPGVLAERRWLGGPPDAALDQRARLRQPHAAGLPVQRLACRHPSGDGDGLGRAGLGLGGSIGGHRLVDGRYAVQLVGRAGGRTYTAPSVRPLLAAQVTAYAITIDTVRPKLTGATIGGRLISPPRDGRHDAVRLAGSSTGATRWRLTAAALSGGAPGAPIRTIGGAGGRPRTSWDGRTDTGRPAADGRYRLTLAVLDPAGNFAARSWDVSVDGAPPTWPHPPSQSRSRRTATAAPIPRPSAGPPRSRPRCRSGSSTAPGSCAPSRVAPAPRPARPLGRPWAGGAEAGRWRLPAPDHGPGRGREPADAPDPDPGRPDRRLAALGAERVLPAGPRHACPDGPRDVQARPRGDDVARGRRRHGGCRPDRVVRPPPDQRSGRLDLGWPDRRSGRWSVRARYTHRPDRTERRTAPTTLRQPIVVDAFAIATSSRGPGWAAPWSSRSDRPRPWSRPTGGRRSTRPAGRRSAGLATRCGPGRFTVRFTVARTGRGPALDQGQRHRSRRPTERVGPLVDGPLSVAEGPASPVHCSG